MTLREPGSLGTSFAKVFFGIGLVLPFATGVIAVLYAQAGLIGSVKVHPWDDVLSLLFLLALFITPESICVYLFQNKIIRSFMARLGFVVIVVFLYANYIFLPPTVYTVLPETAGTLLWAVWPPLATLALGLVVGRVESRQVFSSGLP